MSANTCHYSHNEFHLGDNLIHLHFLRKLHRHYPALTFVHAVQPCHLAQLSEAIEDMVNVKLIELAQKLEASVNVWKNAVGYWQRHRFRNHYAPFYIEWFDHLARGMGLESPIRTPKDLWFDYPKIGARSDRVETMLSKVAGGRFDFLVVNSRPCSGQFMAYDSTEYLTPLIAELAVRHRVAITQPLFIDGLCEEHFPGLKSRVTCTMDYGLTLSEIGALSLHADHLLMVSTGPSWPTFNVWNTETVKLRLLLLENELVDYAPNTVQVQTVAAAREVLKERRLL